MARSLPAFTQDNQYPFSYLRMGQLGYNSPGVVLAGDMQVSPGTGLQVQISAGEAYVQQTVARLGSFYAQRGVYQIFDDSVDNPYNTITAPVANPRVDQVIARVYDAYEQQLAGSSYWRYEWLMGTETSGADLTNLNGAATLPDNSLRLAYGLATVGMSSWSSGNILNIGVPTRTFPGSVNVSGVIEVGGKTILTCTTTQPSRSVGTSYQPNTTRPTLVIATLQFPTSGPNAVAIKIGTTSSPATTVATVALTSYPNSISVPVSFAVPAAYYYELSVTSGTISSLAVTEQTL